MFKKWMVVLSFIITFAPAYSAAWMARMRGFARNGAANMEMLNARARAMRAMLESETGSVRTPATRNARTPHIQPTETPAPRVRQQQAQNQFEQARAEGMRMRQRANNFAQQAERPTFTRAQLETLLEPAPRPEGRPVQGPRPQRAQETPRPQRPLEAPVVLPQAASSAAIRLAPQTPQERQENAEERIDFPAPLANIVRDLEEEQEQETNQQNQPAPQENPAPREEPTEAQEPEDNTPEEKDAEEDYEYGVPEEEKVTPVATTPTEEQPEEPTLEEEVEEEPTNATELPVHELPVKDTAPVAPKGDSVNIFETAFTGNTTVEKDTSAHNSQLKNVRSSIVAGGEQKPEIRRFIPKPSGQLYKKEPRAGIKKKNKITTFKETFKHTAQGLFGYLRDLCSSLFKLIQKIVQPFLFWL